MSPPDDEEHPFADAALVALDAGARGPARRLYAAVDAARDPRLLARVREEQAPARCLFHGVPPEVQAASPWLVDLTDHDGLCSWLVELGLGRSFGLFLASEAPLDALERHCRTFLRVRREDGRTLLFRWWDPRVLRVYLPTCTPAELDHVFGPVATFWAEERDPDLLLCFSRGPDGGLATTALDLSTAPRRPADAPGDDA